MSLGVQDAPHLPGVYAVAYEFGRPDEWPLSSCGGWHKGRDPTVAIKRLAENWVDGSDIVYVGRTDRTLAKRLKEFSRFGSGQPVAHWGGRLIWQLPNVSGLSVGWRALDAGLAIPEESALLEEFIEDHGRLPFANLKR